MPRGAHLPSVRRGEVRGQFFRRHFRHVQHARRRLAAVPHAPDAPALFVAARMIARDFVVRDDAVVPVGDVEAAVRAEGDRHRPEHRVRARHEVARLFESPHAVFAERCRDRVDFPEDWIRHEKAPVPRRGIRAAFVVANRHPGKPRPAKVQPLGGRRMQRRRGVQLRRHKAGVGGVFLEGHHAVTEVIGLVKKDAPGAAVRPGPDVVQPRADDPRVGAVGLHRGDQRLVEIERLSGGVAGFAVIEHALGKDDARARHLRELMRQRVGVLHAETLHQHAPVVRLAVAVFVVEENDLRSLRHDRPAPVREHRERHHHALGEDPRGVRSLAQRRIQHHHAILAFLLPDARLPVARIFRGRDRPQPPGVVERRHRRLRHARFLARHQFHGEALRQREGGEFLRRGARLGVGGVVGFRILRAERNGCRQGDDRAHQGAREQGLGESVGRGGHGGIL